MHLNICILESTWPSGMRERVAEWLRRLTHKPKVRTAEVRIPRWTVWLLFVTLARVDQSHVREIW